MKRLVWAIFLPLAFAGWLLSHCLAYQLVGPADDPHHMLDSSGHGGDAYLPPPAILLAAALPIVFACLVVGRGLLATASRVGAGLRAMFVRRVRAPRLLLRPLRPRTIIA